MEAIMKKYREHRKEIHRFLRFGLIGGIGTIINTVVLYALTELTAFHVILASVIATETAIIANFFGNHYFTFKENAEDAIGKKFLSFQIVSITTVLGTAGILWALVTLFGENYLLLLNLAAILVMFVANYALNKALTWNGDAENVLNVAILFKGKGGGK